ncbi:MAG: hypothetical protein JW800_04965 [Candidatus Omnitrophica bacterium]|nr:hypothetical protein [Candidatus Omnitrophota bacterium]
MKRKYSFLTVSLIIGIIILFVPTTSDAFSLFISPSSYKETAKPGQTVTGTVRIINEGKTELGIRAYEQDWTYEPDGTKVFHPPGTTPLSCSKWIQVFPRKFRVQAGSDRTVQFNITVPENAEGGYYSVIFFESFDISESEKGENRVTVQFAARLGCVIYIETEGKSIHRGIIESLSVTPPSSTKPLEMSLVFKNQGNTYLSADGTLSIIDDGGNVYGRQRLGFINTLPGDTRFAKAEWFGDLAQGTYDAVVTLDMGTDTPILGETSFTVSAGGSVESFRVDSSGRRPVFTAKIKNTGDLNIEVTGNISIIDKTGNVVQNLSLKKTYIAPKKEKELKEELKEDLLPGAYTAKATISVGEKQFVIEEVFQVK